MLSGAFVVRLSTVAQPWFALHQADGCTGVSPPPPQLPPAMRHQFPMPSDVLSVSYRSGKPKRRCPSSWQHTPILASSGTVRYANTFVPSTVRAPPVSVHLWDQM